MNPMERPARRRLQVVACTTRIRREQLSFPFIAISRLVMRQHDSRRGDGSFALRCGNW